MRLVLYTLVASLLCFYTPTGVDFIFQDDSAHAAVKRPPQAQPKPKPKTKQTNLKAKSNPLKKNAALSAKLKPNFKLPKNYKVNLKPQSLRTLKNTTRSIRNKLMGRYAPGNKPLRVAKPNMLKNALKNFRPKNYRAGNHTFKLTKERMKHIMESHHPKYWSGKGLSKKRNDFFKHNTSTKHIESAIKSVFKQNQSKIAKLSVNQHGKFRGTYKGKTYELGIQPGKIGTFHPINN